jgi:hypothetical protein
VALKSLKFNECSGAEIADVAHVLVGNAACQAPSAKLPYSDGEVNGNSKVHPVKTSVYALFVGGQRPIVIFTGWSGLPTVPEGRPDELGLQIRPRSVDGFKSSTPQLLALME